MREKAGLWSLVDMGCSLCWVADTSDNICMDPFEAVKFKCEGFVQSTWKFNTPWKKLWHLLIGRSLQNNHIETNIEVQNLFPELAQEKGGYTPLSCMKI